MPPSTVLRTLNCRSSNRKLKVTVFIVALQLPAGTLLVSAGVPQQASRSLTDLLT